MADQARFGSTDVVLVRGDITRQAVDGVVNAANSSLLGGGGVDGAIHRAGGPEILAECKQIRAMQGQCAPGEAVLTGGGRLPARFVIHTVGPIWRGGKTNEEKLLSNAYRNSLQLAVQYEMATVAFPSISTGAYGYPLDLAAAVALRAVKDFCEVDDGGVGGGAYGGLKEVRFVLFDQFTHDAYRLTMDAL